MCKVKENVVFRLDPDKKNDLDKAAVEKGMNRSELLQKIIDDYLGNTTLDRYDLWELLSLVTKKEIRLSENEKPTEEEYFAIKRIVTLKHKLEDILFF